MHAKALYRYSWLAVMCAALLLASPASAARLELGHYEAGGGEVNRLTLTYSDGWFNYSDPGVTIEAIGPDCEPTGVTGHSARCRADTVYNETSPDTHSFVARPSADLGDGDDAADVVLPPEAGQPTDVSIAGGPGADELTVRSPRALIHGDRDDWRTSPDDGPDRIAFDGGVAVRPESAYEPIPTAGTVNAGGGDDTVTVTGIHNRVLGATGNDTITGDDLNPPPPDTRCKAFVGYQCFYDIPGQNCWNTMGVLNDEIEGGPGDDTIRGLGGEDRLFGQDGRDVVEGGEHCDVVAGDQPRQTKDHRFLADESMGGDSDVLDGGGETDTVIGGVGDDRVAGGDGYDTLSGGGGADTYDGGPGIDYVDYGDRAGPIVATLDGGADDGEVGERDDLGTEVEDVTGTPAADRLVGNAAPNRIAAGDGNDVIVAGGGSDFIRGQGGSDQIHALEGEPAVPHTPIPGVFVPGLTSWHDDAVVCDEKRLPPPPADLGYQVPDPGEPGASDTVVADPSDGAGQGGTPFVGCEVVLHTETSVVVDPEITTNVPTPAYCDAGITDSLCRATAVVLTPSRAGSLKGARFKPPKAWQRLGKRSYEAKLGGKRRRVRVPVSRSAARRARGGKRVKAYVAYRYRKPKR